MPTKSALKHPLPIGTRLRSLQGEADCDGSTEPGAVGTILGIATKPLSRQGWGYHVAFPLAVRAPDAENPKARIVEVIIDQADSIDDPGLYELA